jgi:hypothetical protein
VGVYKPPLLLFFPNRSHFTLTEIDAPDEADADTAHR